MASLQHKPVRSSKLTVDDISSAGATPPRSDGDEVKVPTKSSFAVAHSWMPDRALSLQVGGPAEHFKLVRSSHHGDIESVEVEACSAYVMLRISFDVEDDDDDIDDSKARVLRTNLLKEMGLRPMKDTGSLMSGNLCSRYVEEARIMWKYLCDHYIISQDAINQVNAKLGVPADPLPSAPSSSTVSSVSSIDEVD